MENLFPTLKVHNSYIPHKRVFGVNSVDELGKHIKDAGIPCKKAAIITDKGIAKTDIVARVTGALKKEGIRYAVFSDVKEDPDDASCDVAAEFVRKEAADFCIGLGGGSAMDTTKVAAEVATLPGKSEEYLQQVSFPSDGLPIVQIPTTSGTGAECTPNAVVGFHRDGIKGFVVTPYILADLNVVDPSLTLSVPQKVTAATGADALSHAIETVLARQDNPFSDALAFQAIKLIGESLPTAVFEGSNIEARVKMSYGSHLAGLAFQEPGIIEGHALAHTLGSVFHVPHGIGCAIGLCYCMEYNMGAGMEKLARIARLLGRNTDGLSTFEAAKLAVTAVKELFELIQVPLTWAQYGTKDDFERLIDMMVNCPWITAFYGWCKRPMTRAAAEQLVVRSYEGLIGGPWF